MRFDDLLEPYTERNICKDTEAGAANIHQPS